MLTGAWDADRDPGARVAATGQGRGVVVGQVVALGAAVGRRIELHAEGGRGGADGCRVVGDIGLVTCGVGDLGRHFELGAVGRCSELDDELPGSDLGLGEGNGQGSIAGGIDGHQIAGNRILGQSDLDADSAVEFAGVDEAVVVLVFGEGDAQALECGQIDLGKVGAGGGSIAGGVEQEGVDSQGGAINRHGETGSDEAIGFVGGGNDDIAGGGAVGGADGVANFNQAAVELDADIGVALGFKQIDETIVVGVVGNVNIRCCTAVGWRGVGRCRQVRLLGWQVEGSQVARRYVVVVLRIDGFGDAQELYKGVPLVAVRRQTCGRCLFVDDIVQIFTFLQCPGDVAHFFGLGKESTVISARRWVGRHFRVHGDRFTGADIHYSAISQHQGCPTTLAGNDAFAFHDRVATAQSTNCPVGTSGKNFSGNVGNLGNGL